MTPLSAAASRVLLLADDRAPATGPHAAKVRRYRLARVRLAERREQLAPLHTHLLKPYD